MATLQAALNFLTWNIAPPGVADCHAFTSPPPFGCIINCIYTSEVIMHATRFFLCFGLDQQTHVAHLGVL